MTDENEFDVLAAVRNHNKWRSEECINLLPSENVTSPKVREILASDLGHRYTAPINAEVHGVFVENAYGGTRYADEIQRVGEELACRVFGADYACLEPLSGHISVILMLLSTCNKGGKILSIHPKHGGYDGYFQDYVPEILGMKADYIPFDLEEGAIDYERLEEKIKEFKPDLVVLGASYIPFPYDIPRIKDLCEPIDCRIGYDGSHVLGLIAGGEFQRPLEDGADILIGSTHKTFFGPQGGIVLTNDPEIHRRVRENLMWRLIDNAHWNRIAALTQALQEALLFGKDYAVQIVKNARALGEYLDTAGIPLRYKEKGYTSSHQLLFCPDFEERVGMSNNDFTKKLEESNIITDAVGRIGTNEVTRLGMEEGHMMALSEYIGEVIFKGKNVKDKVIEFRKGFEISYC